MTDEALIPELSCTDYARSLKFYTHALQFSVLYDRPEEGFAMLEREGARIMIDLISVGRSWTTSEMKYPFGRGINLQIQTQDVESLYQNVQDHNGSIFLDMEEKWYRSNNKMLGNKQFIVQDPDGYLLRFFESMGEKAIL